MSYERESKEFVPLEISVDGTQQNSGNASAIEVCIVPLTFPKTRPGTWVPIGTLQDEIGILIGPGTANDFSDLPNYPVTYMAWAQITDSPEIPVIDCGSFRIE